MLTLKKMRSIFEILQDGEPIFRGRMTEDTRDFDNAKVVDLEGVLAFLNDSVVEPFSFPEDFLNNSEYNAAASSGNVIQFFLKWLIDNHNSQVEDFQKLKLGKVTVSDPNNYLYRSISEYESTWQVLKGKLFDSTIGGYLCIRYEADGNYIDYLDDFEFTNSQPIEYGENLLDYTCESDSSATYSAVLPLGKKQGESEDAKRLTIADLPDGNITSDLVKTGKIIYSKSAREQYGFILAPASETTWDDVADINNLKSRSVDYMTKRAVMLTNTITIKAFDLHFSDEDIEAFRIYGYVNLLSKPHNEDDSLKLTKLELDLQAPQNTAITLGEIRQSLTDINAGIKKDAASQLESFKVEVNKIISESKAFIGVKNTAVFYYLSTSSTELIGGEWSETSPEFVSGHYYWQKVVTTYTDNSTTESDPVCISGDKGEPGKPGTDGTDGVGISNVRPMYYRSTSKESQIGGEWVDTAPVWSAGYYMWTKTIITYTDGTSQETSAVCDSTWEAVVDASGQLTEYFLSEIEQLADSITLEVSGSLGSNASIILSAGANKNTYYFDLTEVRKAFANDPTAISISAGTITFNSNTLMINSSDFQLSADGKITATGGKIANWNLDNNSLFAGDTFETSTAFICTGSNTALTIAGHTARGWVFKAGSNFGVTRYGELYCTSAYLSGIIANEYGLYKTVLDNGSLQLYYNDKVYGHIDTRYYTGQDSNNSDRGIALRLGTNGKYIVFATTETTSSGAQYEAVHYYLNRGAMSNYDEVHIFQSSVRFTDSVYMSSHFYTPSMYLYEGYFIKSVDDNDNVGEEMLGFSSGRVTVGSVGCATMLRGTTVYLKNTSTTVTSDRNAKNSIEELPDAYGAFLDNLSPVRFKYNEGTSGRYHVGYIAQDVEAALTAAGLTSKDFAGYVDVDFSGELGLSYDEFIAALHMKIKRLETRIEELEKGSVAA